MDLKKDIKNKFLIIMLLLITVFGSKEKVLAKVSCYYKDDKIQMRFNINDDGSAEKVTIKGNIESSDENKLDGETEPISNWDNPDITNFLGSDYFKNKNSCPPYLAFFDRRASFRVYAGETPEELSEIKEGLEGCNWLTLCINGGVQGWSGAVKLTKQTNLNKDNKDDSGFSTVAESCAGFGEKECKSSENPKCVWNDEYKFCSVTGLSYLSCGDAKDIPPVVPTLTSYAVNILKIVTPIILILVGIIELVKAMASSNEDSMKKAQSKLIKKVVAAVMVFFVITIVQFVILKVADSGETGSIKKCLKCFLNNDCNGSTYYKDGYGMCYYLDDKSKTCDDI